MPDNDQPKQTSADDETLSPVLSFGHAEYTLPAVPGLVQEHLWNPVDDFQDDWDENDAVAHFRTQHGFDPPDADLSWESIFRITGSRSAIEQAFNGLLTEIATPPGGDDDSYDYWPSGVRLAHDITGLLDRDAELRLARAVADVFAAKATQEDWNPEILGFDDLVRTANR